MLCRAISRVPVAAEMARIAWSRCMAWAPLACNAASCSHAAPAMFRPATLCMNSLIG